MRTNASKNSQTEESVQLFSTHAWTLKAMLFILSTAIIFGCRAEDVAENFKAARFDDTDLCFPTTYVPSASPIERLLAPVADQLDSSKGEERIYIPVAKVKEMVPEFTDSHINSRDVVMVHNLSGIASSLSRVSNVNYLADAAWNVKRGTKPYLIEPDPDLPYYRIYPYHKPFSTYKLVKSPPPEDPKGGPPEDWYIAGCSESMGSFTCFQTAIYKSVFFRYRLHEHDFHLRDELRNALVKLFQQWESNCTNG
ncbi:MAG: hypothetical protein AB8G18_19270 [Gammaproteobacteria bacterium]